MSLDTLYRIVQKTSSKLFVTSFPLNCSVMILEFSVSHMPFFIRQFNKIRGITLWSSLRCRVFKRKNISFHPILPIAMIYGTSTLPSSSHLFFLLILTQYSWLSWMTWTNPGMLSDALKAVFILDEYEIWKFNLISLLSKKWPEDCSQNAKNHISFERKLSTSIVNSITQMLPNNLEQLIRFRVSISFMISLTFGYKFDAGFNTIHLWISNCNYH